MKECSRDANFGLSCYVIELRDLVRIVRRIIDVGLSERSLKTATSTLKNVAGETSRPSPPLSLQKFPDLVPPATDTTV